MRKLPAMVALLFTLTIASSALAAGYGAAGCGWGGKVIGKNNDILAQLGATVLNGFLSNQTFGITSGTSGCGKSGLVMAENEQTIFVQNNYNSLAKEMAAGEGENLNTLAGLMGCSADQTQHFAVFTKDNYNAIFKSEQDTPSEMLATLKQGLSGDPVLAASCPKI
jgi:predicted AAA+ superfamily ATPase